MQIVRCLFQPSKTFAVVITDGRWLGAFIVVAVVRLIVGGIFFLQTQLPAQGGADFRAVVIVAFLLYPTLLWFLQCALFAGVVMLFLIVAGSSEYPVRYRRILTAVVYANGVLLVRDAVELALSVASYVHSAGAGLVRLKIPALDRIVSASPFMTAITESVDPISLWFIILAAIGVAEAGRVSRTRAMLFVTVTWILGTFWGAGLRTYVVGAVLGSL